MTIAVIGSVPEYPVKKKSRCFLSESMKLQEPETGAGATYSKELSHMGNKKMGNITMRSTVSLILSFCMLGLVCSGCGSDGDRPVSRVTDSATLRDFVEDAAERLQNSPSFEDALQLINEFRQVGGDWNDGSTYLILLTGKGGLYIHSKNRELEDEDWSNLEDAMGKNVGQQFLQGGFVEYHAEGDQDPRESYAFSFSAPNLPLTNPLEPESQRLVLIGGFDYEPEVQDVAFEDISGSRIVLPRYDSSEVSNQEKLKRFVNDASAFFTKAMVSDEIGDIAQLRKIFRYEGGPWRNISTYIYIMDDRGNVIFNAANRDIEQTNLWEFDANGQKVIQELIAAAKMSGGGFVEYNWDDPAVEGDEPGDGGAGGSSAKLGYAKAIPLDKDEEGAPINASRVYVFGSGLYPGQ